MPSDPDATASVQKPYNVRETKMRGNDMDRGRAVVKAGASFGSALAMVISWTANKSLLWAIVHGLLSWLYVIYYALRYHFKLVSF